MHLLLPSKILLVKRDEYIFPSVLSTRNPPPRYHWPHARPTSDPTHVCGTWARHGELPTYLPTYTQLGSDRRVIGTVADPRYDLWVLPGFLGHEEKGQLNV